MQEIEAAVIERAGLPPTIETLLLDDPRPGEVLVRMTASGVCHSDLHVRDGEWERPGPIVMGHEGAGIVEAVGDGIDPGVIGRPVALSWYAPCLRCRECQRGRQWVCTGLAVDAPRPGGRHDPPRPPGRLAGPRLLLDRDDGLGPGRPGDGGRAHARRRPARGRGAHRLRRVDGRRGGAQDRGGARRVDASRSSGSAASASRASWAP